MGNESGMSKEPVHLIMEQLKLLRGEVLSIKTDVHDIKDDIKEMRLVQVRHTLSLDFLTERVEKLRE